MTKQIVRVTLTAVWLLLPSLDAVAQDLVRLRLAPSALLSIDQNRSAIVERIVAEYGEALTASASALTSEELRNLLTGMRADHLLAASLAGDLDGLRNVIANALSSTAEVKSGLQTKAVGDAADDLVYTPVVPCRIVDTRNAGGAFAGGGETRNYHAYRASGTFASQGGAATNCAIPANPAAVALNVATVGGGGFLTAWPYNTAQPLASTLNPAPGLVMANGAIVPACQPNCAFEFSVFTFGAQVVIDIVGYFKAPGAPVGTVTSITAGTGLTGGTITGNGTISIDTTIPFQVGTNVIAACDAPHAGSIRWNSAASALQLCDGAAWRAVTVGAPQYNVGGTVSGLSGTLQLQNNGGATINVSSNGSFQFPAPLAAGNPYSVTVLTAPAGQICDVANGTGTVNNANVTNVAITCAVPAPLLWYAFEGNGTNQGAFPGPYTLNFVNSNNFVPGKVGQGVQFSATGYAQVAGMRTAMGNYGQITVAFWTYQPTLLNNQTIWDTNNRTVAPYGGVQLGQFSSAVSVCVSTTTNSFVGGGCNGFTSPSLNTWHHWIVRYAGTGIYAGQGAPVDIYVDNVLVHSRANDANNNPVFNSTGMNDTMSIAGSGLIMDELKVFNRTFTLAQQCTFLIGGTWNGASCTLP